MAYQVTTNLPIEDKLNSKLRILMESGLLNFYHDNSVFLIQLSAEMSEHKQRDSNEVGQYQNSPLLTISPFLSIMAVYFTILTLWCTVFIMEIIYFRHTNKFPLFL